jgi:hypothetical protein
MVGDERPRRAPSTTKMGHASKLALMFCSHSLAQWSSSACRRLPRAERTNSDSAPRVGACASVLQAAGATALIPVRLRRDPFRARAS